MIDPKELRIGNLINESPLFSHPETGFDVVEVAVINDIDKVVRDQDDNIYGYDELYPIPLTPEILQKCGFELFPYGWVRRAKTRSVRLTPMNFLFEREGQTSLKIKSLHQIQNLFFSLTGEELEVNFHK